MVIGVVYGGFIDKLPMGAVMNRGLTIRAGQCHVPGEPPTSVDVSHIAVTG